jgi:chaperonin GroES
LNNEEIKTMASKVTPLGDRVLVQQDEKLEKTAGGLFLPGTAEEAPQRGVIVCAGKGRMLEDGKIRPLSVKAGDKIIFGKYSGTKIKMGAEELLFMREEDIMAVIED